MAKQTLSTIKNWFKTSLKPTQQQFWDTWDSFWHKDDSIPSGSVEGLNDALASKATNEALMSTNQAVTNNTNALSNKVDKIDGKGLSSEDYTATEKTKLDNIEEGAEVNVQPDWNQADDTIDDYIKNKPDLSVFQESSSQLVTWATGAEQPTSDADYVIGEFVEEGLTYIVTNITLTDGKTVDLIQIVDTEKSYDFQFPSLDGEVKCIYKQNDGSLLIGGAFTGYIKRLKPDGSEDVDFSSNLPLIGGAVYFVVARSDGSIIAAKQYNYIKLNSDGSEDATFSISAPPANDFKIDSDNSLFIGYKNGLYKILSDGTADNAFLSNLPDLNSSINSIFISTSTIFIAGYSGTVGGFAMKLLNSGIVDSGFSCITDEAVHSVVEMTDGSVIIGGEFTGFLKKLNADGSENTTFSSNLPTIDGAVLKIAIDADSIYLIGEFSGYIKKLNSDGSEDSIFSSNLVDLDGVVSSIIYDDNSLFIGGSFTGYINKLNVTGTSFTRNELVDYLLEELRQKVDKVYGMGLSHADYTDTEKTKLENIEEGAEVNVQSDWGQADDTLDDFIKNKPDLSSFVRTSDSKIIDWNAGEAKPTSDADHIIGEFVEEGLTYMVTRISLQDGKTIDIIQIVDNVLNVFNASYSGGIYSVIVNEDKSIIIGGFFSGYLKKLNTDGSEDTTFSGNIPLLDNGVKSIAICTDGSIIIAGWFSGYLKKLNADGSEDANFTNNLYAFTAKLEKIAIGFDNSIVCVGQYGEYLRKLNADGSEDSAFSSNIPSFNTNIQCVAINTDNTILIGGGFTGTIKKLNADGSEVTSFASNFPSIINSFIRSIAINQDGTIIIAGYNIFKKLNADGSEVTSFASNVPTIGTSQIYHVAIDNDGSIFIGGTIDGYLKKLNSDGTEIDSFTTSIPEISYTVDTIVINDSDTILIGGEFTGNIKKLWKNGQEYKGTYVSYILQAIHDKVNKDELTGISEISDDNLDWSGKHVQHVTLASATTLTFSNLVAGKKINMVADGNFAITWPAYVIDAGGTIGATKTVYELICTNSTTGSEEVWVRIIGAE